MIQREEIIRMAREAGAPDWWIGIGLGGEVSGPALQWAKCFAAMVESKASAQPAFVFGFFWTDCIHESAPALQSLHRSKREALRAMIRAQYAHWEADRDNGPPSLCRLPRRSTSIYRRARAMQHFSVRPVRVLP